MKYRKILSNKEKVQIFKDEKRKHVVFTKIDHAYRKSLRLTVTQYMVLDEIYRKQNLSQRFADYRTGWCWQSREKLAELFRVSVDFVDVLVKRRQDLLEVSKEDDTKWYLRVKNWTPDHKKANENYQLSIVYPEVSRKMKITYEEQCLLTLLAHSAKYFPDETLTNAEIQRRLCLSKETIVNMIDGLWKKKWIEREYKHIGNMKRQIRLPNEKTFLQILEIYQTASKQMNQIGKTRFPTAPYLFAN